MPRYRYELRRGETIVATGHLERPDALEIGDGGHAVRNAKDKAGHVSDDEASSLARASVETSCCSCDLGTFAS
jgi:hypothetical protein